MKQNAVSKVMALGALMAAVERDLPVAHLESNAYELKQEGIPHSDTTVLLHVWLAGEAYPPPRPPIPLLLEDAGKGYSSRSHSIALPEAFSRNMKCTSPNTLESKACFNFIGSAWRRDVR